jgi:integrase
MFEPAALSEVVSLPELARGWREQVERYVEKRSKESLSRRYAVLETRRILVGIGGALDGAGLACLPARLGDAQLDHLLNVVWRPSLDGTRGLASKTRRYYTCVLNGFLKDAGNLALERRKLKFPKGSVRPKRALTEEESGRLLRVASAMGIVPHAIVALEMTMGLRRCEVLRVSLGDLEDGELLVHGKGRGGEKLRRVPYHPEVQRILPELLAQRSQVLQGYSGPDDGRVFVHRTEGSVRVWSRSWVDSRVLEPAFIEAGIRRAWNLNHCLRRTFGRTMWRNGVPLEVVSLLMGHEDIRQTRGYLAIDQADMASAMSVLGRAIPPLAVAGA